jgi:HK97 family phage prohead protease
MHTKYLPVHLKAGPDDGLAEGEFTAYASVFGNVDSYGDVVVKGAFTEDLAAWKASGYPIPLLFGHNMYDPDFNIGAVDAQEDDHGLLVHATLDLENPKASQTYRLIKGKRINQMSFAYDVLESGQATQDGETVNELRKLHVYEVSVVPIGANQETEILAVKANAFALISGIKEGRVLASKHIDSLRSAQEAIGSVIAAAEGTEDQEKASGQAETNDEEPEAAKSEESRVSPSARALAVNQFIQSL